jgi:Caspase domain.
MNAQPDTAAYHALLIGINDYPDKPLKGCVSDVYYIKSHLEDTLGDAIQIHLLIAGIPAGQDLDLSAQNSALWPSYHNVISALRNITAQSKEGDCVYIHYSGHGTQDPEDGDLALVLLNENLGQPQIELLWTDVLANMVQAMADKGLR